MLSCLVNSYSKEATIEGLENWLALSLSLWGYSKRKEFALHREQILPFESSPLFSDGKGGKHSHVRVTFFIKIVYIPPGTS